MMYACKIKIKYEPQKIKYEREIKLPDQMLSIDDLSKLVDKNETFYFDIQDKNSVGDSDTFLIVCGHRYETKEELTKRIKKEELYNENYEKHHNKYKKLEDSKTERIKIG